MQAMQALHVRQPAGCRRLPSISRHAHAWRATARRRAPSIAAPCSGQAGGGSKAAAASPPAFIPSAAMPAGATVFPTLLALAAQYQQQLQQYQQQQQQRPSGASVDVRRLTFHPPGSELPLLSDVNLTLSANTLNLIIGRSGSGKTTLLQLLAGLCEQTSGDVCFVPGAATPVSTPAAADGAPAAATAAGSSLEERMQRVGLVFQFPERHFLGDTIASELSFAWPPTAAERWTLGARAQSVLAAVGLSHVPLHQPPYALSGGQQRRLALAVQLVRQPSLLLLDEPLAGLDWQARGEVAALLAGLKRQCTLLVVSHDIKEIAPLVDRAWEMKPGGTLGEAAWPPADASFGALWGRAKYGY